MKKNNVIYILNPLANEGNARKQWTSIQKKFHLPKDPLDITKIDNLTEFIAAEKPTVIAIAGGDGTVNSVSKALLPLKEKPSLLVMPLGFGNALTYCFGTETPEKAVYTLRNRPQEVTVDIIKTSIPELPVGIFTMGVGFDGQIVHTRMYHRYIGLRSYILSTIQSYLTHVPKRFTIVIDKKVTFTAHATALIIANAPTIGRNVILSEDAKMNDGLLNCTLFSSRYAYLANLRIRGFKHPLYSEQNKVYFQARHIQITGEQFAQVDGDPAVLTNPLEIEIAKKQITFVTNKPENILLPALPFV